MSSTLPRPKTSKSNEAWHIYLYSVSPMKFSTNTCIIIKCEECFEGFGTFHLCGPHKAF